MRLTGELGLVPLLKKFRLRIGVTWALVAAENVCLALIPLFIGFAIDDLLTGDYQNLWTLVIVLISLTALMVIRRIVDTRSYGAIRVVLGMEVDSRHKSEPVSTRNARVDMASELADFLEEEVPQLLTAFVQIIVSLIILASFHSNLSLSAFAAGLGMLLVYACFHKRFYNLNSKLNSQMESQVDILFAGNRKGIFQHLCALNNQRIRLSDTEAIVYGLIFLLSSIFICFNLVLCADLPNVTAGKIFSIVSYSWEYVTAVILLPVALQSLSRLQEITSRINGNSTSPSLLQADTPEADGQTVSFSDVNIADTSTETSTLDKNTDKKPAARNNKALIFICSLLSLLGVMTWVFSAEEPSPVVTQEPRLLPVTVVEVFPQPRRLTVSASGLTEARWPSTVIAAVPGRIESLSDALEPSELINTGQLLVKQQDVVYQSDIDAAASRVSQAAMNLSREKHEQTIALRSSARLQTPFARHEPQVEAATLELKAAKSALANARQRLADTRITSPYEAIILERMATPGQWAQAGETLFRIADSSFIDVRVPLPSRLWNRLESPSPGIEAKVKTAAGNEWPATIRYLSPMRDKQTRQRSLILTVEKPYHQVPQLLPDQQVTATFTGKELADVVVAPVSVLTPDGYVWAVDEQNRLRKTEAQRIFEDDDEVWLRVQSAPDTRLRLVRFPLSSMMAGQAVSPKTEAVEALQ